MNMPNSNQVAGIPFRSFQHAAELPGIPASVSESRSLYLHSSSCGFSRYKKKKLGLVIDWMSKFGKKADSYAQSIRDHVSLGTKFSETLKGKVSLGAKILQAGGVERVFRKNFCVEKGERLLKAFQCYLSTTAGPIAGLLFISNKKIAFHSDRPLRLTSQKGNSARVPYKVLIPIARVKRASQSENSDKPNQKYIQIVTVDDFEFWFMGFLLGNMRSLIRILKYNGEEREKSQVHNKNQETNHSIWKQDQRNQTSKFYEKKTLEFRR